VVNVLTSLRKNGDVPLDWIRYAGRRREQLTQWSDLKDFLDVAKDSYQLDFWENLDHHVCVLVEKDTVWSVIAETCFELRIPCWVSRGYHSLTLINQMARE
jgi:hypothetical protein